MREGDRVAERFVLEAHAASGGMGTVFRAFDVVGQRPVALKTCDLGASGSIPSDDHPRARFEAEASALAHIADAGIVGYVAHGVSHAGEPFLVMDWVEGESLAARLSRQGLTLRESVLLVRDLARSLAVIHSRGIVHRDLKPANVMLRDGDVRRAVLVDFGVARRSESTSITLSGARVGTLLYMAPEQIRDARGVDGRADVFALGCILFECVTGVRAFEADDALATIAQILLDEVPDPQKLRPELPAEAAALVRRMMRRDRDARPQARELGAELDELLLRSERLELGPPLVTEERARSPRPAAATAAEVSLARAERVEAKEHGVVAPKSQRRIGPPLSPRNGFIGRSAELAHLQGLIGSGANCLLVWGPAGIGKTRLCLELARRGVPSKLANTDFVDLGDARDGNDAIRIVSRATGTSFRGTEAPEQLIGRALGRLGAGVLVLDHVEHLGQELGPLLELWRTSAPEVCFVLTSRERIRWAGAVCVEVGPLPARPASSALSPAAELLLQRIRESDPGFSTDSAAPRTLESIAAALQGIPLALELAAARVGLLGLDGVASRLCRQLELLGNGDPAQASSQLSMRAAISASVDLLTSVERRAFAQCAVFCGPFAVSAAEAVLDVPDSGSVLDLLQSLRDKSLLVALGESDTNRRPRVFLFSVVREYALAELAGRGEESKLRARHGAYFARRALSVGQEAAGTHASHRMLDLEADSDNLIAGIHHALSGPEPDVPLGLEALLALEPVISARGPLPSFMNLIDKAAAAAEALRGEDHEDPRLTRLRLLRARISATSGRFDSARADLRRVLEAACAGQSRRGGPRLDSATPPAASPGPADTEMSCRLRAAALLELGVVQHLQRCFGEARASYEQAIGALSEHTDPELEGRCYGNLGALLHDGGRFTEAAAHYWRAIHLLEDAGERRMRGNFLNNLGVLEHELRAPERARRHFQGALTLLLDIGDDRLAAIALGNFGVLEQECGAWERARQHHQQALALFAPLDDSNSEALCLARLGGTLAMLGALAEAEEHLSRAQRVLRTREPCREEAITLQRGFLDLALARNALSAGDSAEARARLERARARCERVQEAREGAKAIAAQSDDVRVTLRILRRHIQACASELGEPAVAPPG